MSQQAGPTKRAAESAAAASNKKPRCDAATVVDLTDDGPTVAHASSSSAAAAASSTPAPAAALRGVRFSDVEDFAPPPPSFGSSSSASLDAASLNVAAADEVDALSSHIIRSDRPGRVSKQHWRPIGFFVASRSVPSVPFFVSLLNADGQPTEVPYATMFHALERGELMYLQVFRRLRAADGVPIGAVRFCGSDIRSHYRLGWDRIHWQASDMHPESFCVEVGEQSTRTVESGTRESLLFSSLSATELRAHLDSPTIRMISEVKKRCLRDTRGRLEYVDLEDGSVDYHIQASTLQARGFVRSTRVFLDAVLQGRALPAECRFKPAATVAAAASSSAPMLPLDFDAHAAELQQALAAQPLLSLHAAIDDPQTASSIYLHRQHTQKRSSNQPRVDFVAQCLPPSTLYHIISELPPPPPPPPLSPASAERQRARWARERLSRVPLRPPPSVISSDDEEEAKEDVTHAPAPDSPASCASLSLFTDSQEADPVDLSSVDPPPAAAASSSSAAVNTRLSVSDTVNQRPVPTYPPPCDGDAASLFDAASLCRDAMDGAQ